MCKVTRRYEEIGNASGVCVCVGLRDEVEVNKTYCRLVGWSVDLTSRILDFDTVFTHQKTSLDLGVHRLLQAPEI